MSKIVSELPKGLDSQKALGNLEDAYGGREAIIDALALSDLDKKQEHFVRLLSDPRRVNDPLMRIAREAGLSANQAFAIIKSASGAKAVALAMGHIEKALPAIAADIADKSVDKIVTCPHCIGIIDEGNICPICNNRGQVLRSSDLDRQKIALQATGVIKKEGGVNLQVNQGVNVGTPSNFFSKFVKGSDDIAYDVDIIDVEPVKTDGE